MHSVQRKPTDVSQKRPPFTICTALRSVCLTLVLVVPRESKVKPSLRWIRQGQQSAWRQSCFYKDRLQRSVCFVSNTSSTRRHPGIPGTVLVDKRHYKQFCVLSANDVYTRYISVDTSEVLSLYTYNFYFEVVLVVLR